MMTLAEYGTPDVLKLALRGLEDKTLPPYVSGWKLRIVPALGHIPVRMITAGAVDRAVMDPETGWIAEECSVSVVKNTLAMLVRIMEQAVRDGIIDRNPARIKGWQKQYARVEDELDDPRSLALPDWPTLLRLADALAARSAGAYEGWRDVVLFAACTAARIGEVSGCRVRDINRDDWTWTVRRQTTTAPGGLVDKGTKGKRARFVPLIEEIREMVERRISATDGTKDARLFVGPAWWPDHHGRPARRDALGRGRDQARVRPPQAPQLAAHRPDVDGRRGRAGPSPSEDRWTRLDHDHTAVPAPEPQRGHRRWLAALRTPQEAEREAAPSSCVAARTILLIQSESRSDSKLCGRSHCLPKVIKWPSYNAVICFR